MIMKPDHEINELTNTIDIQTNVNKYPMGWIPCLRSLVGCKLAEDTILHKDY